MADVTDALRSRFRTYDAVAAGYDGHFQRPVDRWEDERLAELLRPLIDGRDVLDLGCGTGWVADHLDPGRYVGVDRSEAMLQELNRKHPCAELYQAEVGIPGWSDELPFARFDTVVSTWAAEYFVDLPAVLSTSLDLLRPGGIIALHGCQPRGSRRGHFIDPTLAHRGPPFLPARIREGSTRVGLSAPSSTGVGGLPDRLAQARWLWRAGLRVPIAWHYSALHVWQT